MNSTASKPRFRRAVGYVRVATKEQLVSNKQIPYKKKVNTTIRVGDKSYLMPKELMKPIYEYKNRLNAHIILKEKITHLK